MVVGFATLVRKNRPIYLKLFPFFLLIAFIIELWAWRLGMQGISNANIYNFFSVFAFIFYMFVVRHVIFSKTVKRVILYIMSLYAISALVNILFIQHVNTFHTVTYSLGCFLIVVISIYYFYELFQVPRSINLKKEPAFWIVAGLLFFYSCTLPILGVLNYVPDAIAFSLEPIITILNVLLYSLFTIAFLCRINFREFI